jgi:hypothetical protein
MKEAATARPFNIAELRRRLSVVIRFDVDVVIDGQSESLFATEVLLRSLDAGVHQEKLDLLQFSACNMAEAGAGAPQIMRCDATKLRLHRVFTDDMPYNFLRDTIASNLLEFRHAAE